MKIETAAIHLGQEPDELTGSVTVPVYQTSTFYQERIGKHKGYEYSRTGNPTRAALETSLAGLEGGRFGLAFASGLAATTAVLSTLGQGDHVVAGNDLYGGTYRLLEKVFKKWGLQVTYADIERPGSFEEAVQKNTKLIWVETPTNPLLRIVDIQKLARLAKRSKIPLAVDNTFGSPYFQRPLELGADIVVHSVTKYLAGHSDLVGGAVVTSDKGIYEAVKFYQNAAGGVPGPWDCWLVLRGIKTLPVRMKEHADNALFLAKFLERHPKVKRVYYPGLKSHPGYTLAKKQMRGFGGMVSVELKGDVKSAQRFIERLKLFTLAESLGGVESLVSLPAKMTHASIPAEERARRGISDSLVRLSVGLENKSDLQQDLEQALR